MKHIIISISLIIIVLTGLQALPVSPDLKFETPDGIGATERENIRRKKHDNSSPIEEFIHQLPIQLQLSSHKQNVPLRGFFARHTFPTKSSQSIPLYSPIEILQIPRHAIIQSNDNYFQSVNIPQPQLIKIPDFTPTVSSGTFDPTQPTQIIFQRVPVVVEIIDKSSATDSAKTPKESKFLHTETINLEQKQVQSGPGNFNSNPLNKDPITQKNKIVALANEPKKFISVNAEVQDTISEKAESIPEIESPYSVLEGGVNIPLNGDKSSIIRKKEKLTTNNNNNRIATHDVVNLQEFQDEPTDLLDNANMEFEGITHEETLEEIVDRILFEYENLPAATNPNNKQEIFQRETEEEQPTANLKVSTPTENQSNTFGLPSQSPIEHFMKFGIERPKEGNFGMKMLPQNENENEKKDVDLSPARIVSNSRLINSISKSIFNAPRLQSIPISNKSPEVLRQSTNDDMLSTDEIFDLLDQEIDKNISQQNLDTVINAQIDSEFAPDLSLAYNKDQHNIIDNNAVKEEILIAETSSKSDQLLSNDVSFNNEEFMEDAISGGKSLDSQSEKVAVLNKNDETFIVLPDERISHGRKNLDSIKPMPQMSEETESQQSAIIHLPRNEELENKFPVINDEKEKETSDSLGFLTPENPELKMEAATDKSKEKLDEELANLLTEIVAEAVREFLFNKKVVAIPKQLTENQEEADAISLDVIKMTNPQSNDSLSLDSVVAAHLNVENSMNKPQMKHHLKINNFFKEMDDISQPNENNEKFPIPDKFDNQLLDEVNSSSLMPLLISGFVEHNQLNRKLISDSFSVSQQSLTQIDSDSLNQTIQKEEVPALITSGKINKTDIVEKETNKPIIIEHAMKADAKETSQIALESSLNEIDSTTETQLNNYDEINYSDYEIPNSDDFSTKVSQLSTSENDAAIEALSFHSIHLQDLNFEKKNAVLEDGVIEPIYLSNEQELESKLSDIILDSLSEATTSQTPVFENENDFFSTTVNVVEAADAFSEMENIIGHIESTKELGFPIKTTEGAPSSLLCADQSVNLKTNSITATDATLQPDQYDDEESNFAMKNESDKGIFEQVYELLDLQTDLPSLTTDREPLWEPNTDPKNGVEKTNVMDNLNSTEVDLSLPIDKINLKDTGTNLSEFGNEETLQVKDSISVQDSQNRANVDADHMTTEKEKLSSKLHDSIIISITETKGDPDSVFNRSSIFDIKKNEENEPVTLNTMSNMTQTEKSLKAEKKLEAMDLSLFFFNRKINSEKQLKKNANIIEMAADKRTQNKNHNQEVTIKEIIPNNNFPIKSTITINNGAGHEFKDERLSDSLNQGDTISDETFIRSNFEVMEVPTLSPNLGLENDVNRNESLMENVNVNFLQTKEGTDSSLSLSNTLSQDLKLISKFKISTTGPKIDKIPHPGSQSPKVLIPKIVTFFHEIEHETSPGTLDFDNENKQEVLDQTSELEKTIETDAILPTIFQTISNNDSVRIGSSMKVIDVKNSSEGQTIITELLESADIKGDTINDRPFLKIEQIVTFPGQEPTYLSQNNEEFKNKHLNDSGVVNGELRQIETGLKSKVHEEKPFFDYLRLSISSSEPTNRESPIKNEDSLNNTNEARMDSKYLIIASLKEDWNPHDEISAKKITPALMDATNISSFDTMEDVFPVDQPTDEATESSILNFIDSFTNTSDVPEEIHLPFEPTLMRELQSRTNEVQDTDLKLPLNNTPHLSLYNSKENNNTNNRVEITVVSSRKSVSFLDPTLGRRPNLFRRPNVNHTLQTALSNMLNEKAFEPNNITNSKYVSSEKKSHEVIIDKKENLKAEKSKTEISQGRSIIDRLLNELKLVKRDSSFGNANNRISTVEQMIKVFKESSNLGETQMKGFIENLKKITHTFLQQKTNPELTTPKLAREIAGVSEYKNAYDKSKLKNANSVDSNSFNNITNLSVNLTLPLLEMLEKEFLLKDETHSKLQRDKFQAIPDVMEEQLLPLTKLFKKQSVEVNDQEPILSISSDAIINKTQSSGLLLHTNSNFLDSRQNINPINLSDDLKISAQSKFVQKVQEPIKPSLLLSVSHVQSGRSLFPTGLQHDDEFQPIKNTEHLERRQ